MKDNFPGKLKLEISKWIGRGIIDEGQGDNILKLYDTQPKEEKKKSVISLPAIIMGLAAVLLCTGIILFYAANWKSMPPTAKLIQVFLLIITAYGSAFYVLSFKKENLLLGRILLLTGMVSFGAGIMLVAQIFHISSHPTNGILTWALGVLAISWVTEEKWGYYLAFSLFLIWNSWEVTEYNNPNYIFIIFPVILFYLFRKAKAVTGIVLTFAATIIWFYQVNAYWIDQAGPQYSTMASAVFALLHIPLGVILIGSGWIFEESRILAIPSKIASITGWIAVTVPFIFLSWPQDYRALFPAFQWGSLFHTIEYGILLFAGFFMVYYIFMRNFEYRLILGCMAYSFIMLFLPLGNKSVIMTSTHLGLLAFMFSILYFNYITPVKRDREKTLAFFIFIFFIAFKGMGFLGLGMGDKKYFVAYCLGFVIFGVVCFLINQVIDFLAGKKEKVFPAHRINIASAFAGFFIVYALSFKITNQNSIFDAKTVVLVLLFLFLSIAMALYIFLWVKVREKLLLILSAIIFVISTIVIFITGPEISWVAYSLIFNLLLFVVTGTLIYYSTKINSKMLLNFAISGFTLHVITRYFDLFWDLLSGAFLFIITGVIEKLLELKKKS
ncbi:DUF2157 domain-containing protein [Spirochaetota bacterium]